MEKIFRMKKKVAYCVILSLCVVTLQAQNYHAVQGSSYAGSLGIANNPSSMLSTPFRWDVNVIGVQFKASTNILSVHNFSLLSPSKSSQWSLDAGDFARKGRVAYNVNLLNGRFTLNRKEAFGFGANLRGYGRIKTDPYNFNDTLGGIRDFFNINESNRTFGGEFTGSSWIELFASYARTLWDRPFERLNAGVTVKLSRGLAGGFAKLSGVRFQRQATGNQMYYLLRDAALNYGYSSNFDRWQDDKSSRENARDFVKYTEGGIALDFGVEYLLKSGAAPSFDGGDDYYDYEWKFGASLLDVGLNQYKYSNASRTMTGVRPDITDTTAENKLRDITSIDQLNDSLATLVNSFSALSGNFSIINPMRLVLNADRYLFDAFYVNGELSLNLSGLAGRKYKRVSEMNLLTITPRWETKRFGVYMPMQINTLGKFWIGGAFKAGPLLFGVHNWANVFSKDKMHQGGGYVALVIRAFNNVEGKKDRRLNCPD